MAQEFSRCSAGGSSPGGAHRASRDTAKRRASRAIIPLAQGKPAIGAAIDRMAADAPTEPATAGVDRKLTPTN